MTLFEQAASDHAKAIYDRLRAAEAAHPGSPELADLHEAMKSGIDALVQQHPGVVNPADGTAK